MKYDKVSDIPASEIGNYVILGGMGILDGLSLIPCQHSAYKIVNITEDGMTVVSYGKRKNKFLPRHNFCQEAMTYTLEMVKTMPKYNIEGLS